MYTYLHRAQNTYITTNDTVNASSLIHLVHNRNTQRYLNNVSGDYAEIIEKVDIANANVSEGPYDGYLYSGVETVVYSIIQYEDNYLLLSIVKPDFRSEVEAALFNGVIDITMYVVVGVIVLILIWIMYVIRPINQMTT